MSSTRRYTHAPSPASAASGDGAAAVPVAAGGTYHVEVTPVDHFAGDYDVTAAGG